MQSLTALLNGKLTPGKLRCAAPANINKLRRVGVELQRYLRAQNEALPIVRGRFHVCLTQPEVGVFVVGAHHVIPEGDDAVGRRPAP